MFTLSCRLKTLSRYQILLKRSYSSLFISTCKFSHLFRNCYQSFHIMAESFDDKCIFCRIVKERTTEIFYEDDDFLSFKDIRPATSHHYLIVPKNHVKNPATLKASDVELVKKLLSIGEEVLQTQGANTEDARYGYHWPPFNSVQHLHMHAISPKSEMSFISRLIFRPDSYWFVTASSFIEKLEKQEDKN